MRNGECLNFRPFLGAALAHHTFLHSLNDASPALLDRFHHSEWKIVWCKTWGETPWAFGKRRACGIRSVGALWWNAEAGCPEMAIWDWEALSEGDRLRWYSCLNKGKIVGHQMDKMFMWLQFHGAVFTNKDIVDVHHWLKIRCSDDWLGLQNRLAHGFFDDRKQDLDGFLERNKSTLTMLSKNRGMPQTVSEWMQWKFPELKLHQQHDSMFWSLPLDGPHFSAMTQEGASLLALCSLLGKPGKGFPMDLGVDALISHGGGEHIPDLHSRMSPLLGGISNKGIPFDEKILLHKEQEWYQALLVTVDAFFMEHPGILDARHQMALKNITEGWTQHLQEDVLQAIRVCWPEVQFQKTASGQLSLSAESMRFSGVWNSPAAFLAELVEKVSFYKGRIKNVRKILEFMSRSGDGRLHAFLGFGPETDRLLSKEPNVQNFPEDIRALVTAPEDHVLITADYGQIELRIGAALALRCQNIIRQKLDEGTSIASEKAILALLRKGMSMDADQRVLHLEKLESEERQLRIKLQDFLDALDMEEDFVSSDNYEDLFDGWWKCRLQRSWLRILVLRNERKTDNVSIMADVFRKKLDPHLLTGLEMARRSGAKDIPDHLLEVLEADPDLAKTMKEIHADARHEAKPVNFGLLYGMTSRSLHRNGVSEYNLDWTLEDAEQGMDAFFTLYPEFELWQAWTILTPATEQWMLRHRYGRHWNGFSHLQLTKQKVWKISSLQGREFQRLQWRQALNYQDQGTSAHIMMEAMDTLPVSMKDLVINQVHDELVLETPENDAPTRAQQLQNHMVRIADRWLGPYGIPSEVEVEISKVWS